MNLRLNKFAIAGLRWTLSLVVLAESIHFTISPSAAHYFSNTGLPEWSRPALGVSEIIAVLLFLLPAASAAGGCLLLVVFAIAVSIHLFQGEFDVGSLIVYGMAVIVCLTQESDDVAKLRNDR